MRSFVFLVVFIHSFVAFFFGGRVVLYHSNVARVIFLCVTLSIHMWTCCAKVYHIVTYTCKSHTSSISKISTFKYSFVYFFMLYQTVLYPFKEIKIVMMRLAVLTILSPFMVTNERISALMNYFLFAFHCAICGVNATQFIAKMHQFWAWNQCKNVANKLFISQHVCIFHSQFKPMQGYLLLHVFEQIIK